MKIMRKGSRIAAILMASLMLWAWMPSFVYAQPDEPEMIGQSGDAYIMYDETAQSWTFGTAQVEKTVQFVGENAKKFLMTSYINKLVGENGKQYVYQQDWSAATTNLSDEFGVRWAEDSGNHLTGSYNYWSYVNHSVETGSQGELILSITLENVVGKPLTVTRHYQILPQTGVIEEWTDYTNTASYDTTLSELRMNRMRIMTDDAANVVFYNMTGDKVDQKHLLKKTTNLGSAVSYEGTGGDYYQPFGTFYNQQDGDGVFFTWDYTGTWQATVGTNEGKLLAQSKTPSKSYIECKAGETVTTPVSRTGVYVGDLDDMGNQISDYQYKYRWEYTNDIYMNLIRFGGYGYDSETLMNKINANRYIGGDMLWIDDGW